MTITPRTLAGFNDLLPPESITKSKFINILKRNFELFGFVPLETPHLEYTEVLIGNAEGDVQKELFRFQDNGERDVCLRFDLTVPFARVLAQHGKQLGLPFKRYAIGNCFRGERPQKGRYREFTQCDFDFVGVESLFADAEIIMTIISSIKALNVGNFTVRYNNRKLMNALAEELGILDSSAEFLRIIDKLPKIGKDKVGEALITNLNFNDSQINRVFDFLNSSDYAALENLKPYKDKSELYKIAISELEEMESILFKAGVQDFAKLDLSICRGLGYYTGIVYETFLTENPEIGSIASGGRYDQLASNFTKDKLPGVGASIGLDRLLSIISSENLQREKSILLCNMGMEYIDTVFRLANELRSNNLICEVYPESAKLKKQFQYGDRRKFQFVAIYGENERSLKQITLKELSSGTEKTIPLDDLVGVIQSA